MTTNPSLALLVGLLASVPSLADDPEPIVRTLEHSGRERRALVYLPGGRPPASPAPLVLALHGKGQTARSFSSKRGALIRRASELGVVLVFPQGTDVGGTTHWIREAHEDSANRVDDLGYILRLIEDLSGAYAIDVRRIYATGFSSGGVFSHELGSRATSTFAAIAPVAASIASRRADGETFQIPAPKGPVPVLIVNGRRDAARPYDGGPNDEGNWIAPVADAVEFWVENNGCAATPSTEEPARGVRIERHDGEAEVILVSLARMDHQWPDAREGFGWDANREILEFFARHARP